MRCNFCILFFVLKIKTFNTNADIFIKYIT